MVTNGKVHRQSSLCAFTVTKSEINSLKKFFKIVPFFCFVLFVNAHPRIFFPDSLSEWKGGGDKLGQGCSPQPRFMPLIGIEP